MSLHPLLRRLPSPPRAPSPTSPSRERTVCHHGRDAPRPPKRPAPRRRCRRQLPLRRRGERSAEGCVCSGSAWMHPWRAVGESGRISLGLSGFLSPKRLSPRGGSCGKCWRARRRRRRRRIGATGSGHLPYPAASRLLPPRPPPPRAPPCCLPLVSASV